jgi:hypothetical protein
VSFVVPELARQYFTDVDRTAALFAAHAVVADEGPSHRGSRAPAVIVNDLDQIDGLGGAGPHRT